MAKPKLLAIDANKTCLCENCFEQKRQEENSLRCFRLHLAYVGTDFSGFQFQENARTVEGELRSALAKISKEEIKLDAAGRTDAGVHGRGQVVSLTLPTKLQPRQLLLALHTHLPTDMSVWRIDNMPLGFDARRSSVGKRYVYRILQGLVPDPFLRNTAHFVRQDLDVAAMNDAAKLFIGEHDFSSFRASLCTAAHARRYIWHVSVKKIGAIIEIEIRGNAFCMNMVRIISGTLIEVGKQKRGLESISDALKSNDRRKAGTTAPACGLTLEEIYYPDDLSQALIPTNARFPRYPVTSESWPFPVEEKSGEDCERTP